MTLSPYANSRSKLQSQGQQLPTMHNLPSENPLEPGLPDEFHGLQPQLLAETLNLTGYDATQQFNAFDLNLYYDPDHTLWYKRPDWFLVVGVPRMYRGESSRSSYVIWDEQVPPIVVVEFLSPGTEADDLGPFAVKPLTPKAGKPPLKFSVYESILQIPHYIVFDEETLVLRYFRLVQGRYQEQTVSNRSPRIWIADLNIGLSIWRGSYRGLAQSWLRWCDASGNWLLTEAETERVAKESAQAAQKAAQAAQKAAQAEQQRLTDYLRSIGIDPDNLPPHGP
jgi:Uma2 family endonuclease